MESIHKLSQEEMKSLHKLSEEISIICGVHERTNEFREKNSHLWRDLHVNDQEDLLESILEGLQARILVFLLKNARALFHRHSVNDQENQKETIIKCGLGEMIKTYFENYAITLLKSYKAKYQENQKEIIIKCDLEEMVKAFFEEYVIVWHDPKVNNEENQQYIAQLKRFCKVFPFTKWEEAKDFLEKTQVSCHVITSGTNGELLVKEISMKQKVENIYIFCQDKDFHSSWAKDYSKISCIETDIQSLVNKIQENLFKWYKKKSSLKLNLPAFAPIFDDSDKSQMNHLHGSLKVLPNFQNRDQAKDDFLALSKMIFQDPENIKLIADFEEKYQKYDKEQILRWYTRDSFLYKVTNNCLRIATSDSIQYCRLLLKDIEMAIKQQYLDKSKSFSGLLYRGAYLSNEEWLSLKNNINKEIEMHGFLSVSKEKKVALHFVKSDPSSKVFITILVPKGQNDEEQGFAEVEEFSAYPGEKEILFNVRSRFTVLETEDGPYRHLVLLYGAQGFRKFIKEQIPIQEVSIPSFDDIFCAHCKIESLDIPEKLLFVSITDPKHQLYYCKKCVENGVGPFLCVQTTRKNSSIKIRGCLLVNSSQSKTPFYGYRCCKCQAKKKKYYLSCTDCDKSCCGNCFESTKDCREAGHSIILENSPFSFWSQEMSQDELTHMKFQNHLIKDNSAFQQANMYFESHEYEKAIEYYNLFFQENETRKNPKVAASYNNLGIIFDKQGEYKKALRNYLKSLEIFIFLYGDNNSEVASSYNNIGHIYHKIGEGEKALEYSLKSLEMRKSIYGDNHPVLASSYNNLGQIYSFQGEYEKGLEYYLKWEGLNKSINEQDQSLIAACYGDIGRGYQNIGDFQKAFEYHLRSLEIRKSIHGNNHPEVAISYSNLGNTFSSQGEYKKGLEEHLKSLNIYKSVYKADNFWIATSYHNIGNAYLGIGEYKEATEYLLKSLGIRKSVLGNNHPDVAKTYYNLGTAYCWLKELKKALEHYSKCLGILESTPGGNHPSAIDVRERIELLKKSLHKNNQY